MKPYAIRQARGDEESIVRKRIAEPFLTDPTKEISGQRLREFGTKRLLIVYL